MVEGGRRPAPALATASPPPWGRPSTSLPRGRCPACPPVPRLCIPVPRSEAGLRRAVRVHPAHPALRRGKWRAGLACRPCRSRVPGSGAPWQPPPARRPVPRVQHDSPVTGASAQRMAAPSGSEAYSRSISIPWLCPTIIPAGAGRVGAVIAAGATRSHPTARATSRTARIIVVITATSSTYYNYPAGARGRLILDTHTGC